MNNVFIMIHRKCRRCGGNFKLFEKYCCICGLHKKGSKGRLTLSNSLSHTSPIIEIADVVITDKMVLKYKATNELLERKRRKIGSQIKHIEKTLEFLHDREDQINVGETLEELYQYREELFRQFLALQKEYSQKRF